MEDVMTVKRSLFALGVVVGVGLGASACTGGSSPPDPAATITTRTFAVTLTSSPMRLGFLTAEFGDLSVVDQVREATGEPVEPPKLRGTLKVKNVSEDRAARLVGGTVRYLDRNGRAIALAAGRDAPAFTFYSGDRVDPGKETSASIDVPFPAAAMKATPLDDLQVELTYITSPFVREAATTGATVVAHR
jgi:hypothetical protein